MTCHFYLALLIFAVVSCAKEKAPAYPQTDFIYQETGSMLPVSFSHVKHVGRGFACDACHPAVFAMQRGMADAKKELNMKSIYEGRYCGVCHDTKKAFGLEKCSGCHVGSSM